MLHPSHNLFAWKIKNMHNFSEKQSLPPSPAHFGIVSYMRDQSTQTVRYECAKCPSLFTSQLYLHEHEASVHNRIFLCPFCPVLFSNKPDYKTHVTAHSEKRLLPCAFCKKTFYDILDYTNHLKLHREPFLYACNKCPAMFAQLSGLRLHNSIHLKKKFLHTIPRGRPFKKHSEKRSSRRSSSIDESTASENIVVSESVISQSSVPTSAASANTVSAVAEDQIALIETNQLHRNFRKKPIQKKPARLSSSEISSSSNVTNKVKKKAAKSLCKSDRSSKQNRNILASRSSKTDPKPYENVANSSTSNHLFSASNGNKEMYLVCNQVELTNSEVQTDSIMSEDIPKMIFTAKNNVATDSNLQKNNPASNNNANKVGIPIKMNYNLRRQSRIYNLRRKSRSSRKSTYEFFLCLSCKRNFRNFSALQKHKILHIENKGVLCDECGGLFGGPGNLVKHKTTCTPH